MRLGIFRGWFLCIGFSSEFLFYGSGDGGQRLIGMFAS